VFDDHLPPLPFRKAKQISNRAHLRRVIVYFSIYA
jgi:hypothetical protein